MILHKKVDTLTWIPDLWNNSLGRNTFKSQKKKKTFYFLPAFFFRQVKSNTQNSKEEGIEAKLKP